MTVQGILAGGLKTVGQIVPTNEVTFRENLSGMEVAVELLSAHKPGGQLSMKTTTLWDLSANLICCAP
jgi:hypothetical protein